MTAEEYKNIREKLGLTQAGLAALLGVTRKTINARENGAKITEEARLAILALSYPDCKSTVKNGR
jgi:DNA-binding XRE family transcriptional regulator